MVLVKKTLFRLYILKLFIFYYSNIYFNIFIENNKVIRIKKYKKLNDEAGFFLFLIINKYVYQRKIFIIFISSSYSNQLKIK
jgi:hypothetical protein